MSKINYRMAVNVDGTLFTVTDGQLSGGTYQQRKRIEDLTLLAEPVMLVFPFGDMIVPTLEEDDPVGALAALASMSQRWEILGKVPPKLQEFFDDQREKYGEGEEPEENLTAIFPEKTDG